MKPTKKSLIASLVLLLGLAAPAGVGYAQQADDLARMRALEQTPLTDADRQLFLLDGVIWLRSRGETRFRQGEAVTDVEADAAQRRAALRNQALTDQTPYDLVLDLSEAADLAFVEDLGNPLQATERPGFYRVTLTKAQTVALADRDIVMALYPLFPAEGVGDEGRGVDGKASAMKAAVEPAMIFSEDFEILGFPGTRWTVGDDNPANGEDYWDDVFIITNPVCRAHGGNWSAWNAGTGDQPECVAYASYMDAFFYNTSAIEVGEYVDVALSYWLWVDTETGYDFFRRYDSPDGATWTLIDEFDGTSGGWVEQTSDLVGFTDYYVKFVFFSDSGITDEGVYVDDIKVTGDLPIYAGGDGDGYDSASSEPSGATTRYVATTGSDVWNNCMYQAGPCATLTHAVDRANPGDTVDLDAGTYTAPGLVIDKALNIQGAGVVVH